MAAGTWSSTNLRRNKEAAWKFIQFLTREDVNGAVVDLIPANVEAAKTFLEANRKGPDRIMEHLNNAGAAAAVAALPRGLGHRGDAWRRTSMAAWTPKAAADKACKAIDALQ